MTEDQNIVVHQPLNPVPVFHDLTGWPEDTLRAMSARYPGGAVQPATGPSTVHLHTHVHHHYAPAAPAPVSVPVEAVPYRTRPTEVTVTPVEDTSLYPIPETSGEHLVRLCMIGGLVLVVVLCLWGVIALLGVVSGWIAVHQGATLAFVIATGLLAAWVFRGRPGSVPCARC